MRIRAIKPEFWRSDDVDALDWHDRLIFIGMWSYVDDNGVGRDKLASIAADLFAGDLSVDPTETLRRLSLGLDVLCRRDLIRRYEVAGQRYLYVTNWPKHQVVKNPNKPRYPLPTSDYSVPTETLRRPSVDPPETLPTGTGEQGNRGTEEQRIPPKADALAPRDAATPTPTAQTLLAEWLDTCPKRPPGNVVAIVGKNIKQMLAEGQDIGDVRGGLRLWARKGLHPSSLPSVVHEFQVKADRVLNGSSTTNDRVNQALSLADRFAREEQAS